MSPRRIAVVVLLTPLLMIAVPSAAHAAPPVSASGSVTQTSFAVTDTRTVDGVTFFSFRETDSLTGTFLGDSALSGECIQRSTGPILCQAHETFTGTILGRSGTVDFLDLISIDQSTGAVQGRFTILGGTGGLVGIHGGGTFAAQGTTGTYSGRIVFAP
jgi:hypothetical protein